MKLKIKDRYSDEIKIIDFKEYLENELESGYYDSGALESLNDRINNIQTFIINLAFLLIENKTFSKEDILELFDKSWSDEIIEFIEEE